MRDSCLFFIEAINDLLYSQSTGVDLDNWQKTTDKDLDRTINQSLAVQGKVEACELPASAEQAISTVLSNRQASLFTGEDLKIATRYFTTLQGAGIYAERQTALAAIALQFPEASLQNVINSDPSADKKTPAELERLHDKQKTAIETNLRVLYKLPTVDKNGRSFAALIKKKYSWSWLVGKGKKQKAAEQYINISANKAVAKNEFDDMLVRCIENTPERKAEYESFGKNIVSLERRVFSQSDLLSQQWDENCRQKIKRALADLYPEKTKISSQGTSVPKHDDSRLSDQALKARIRSNCGLWGTWSKEYTLAKKLLEAANDFSMNKENIKNCNAQFTQYWDENKSPAQDSLQENALTQLNEVSALISNNNALSLYKKNIVELTQEREATIKNDREGLAALQPFIHEWLRIKHLPSDSYKKALSGCIYKVLKTDESCDEDLITLISDQNMPRSFREAISAEFKLTISLEMKNRVFAEIEKVSPLIAHLSVFGESNSLSTSSQPFKPSDLSREIEGKDASQFKQYAITCAQDIEQCKVFSFKKPVLNYYNKGTCQSIALVCALWKWHMNEFQTWKQGLESLNGEGLPQWYSDFMASLETVKSKSQSIGSLQLAIPTDFVVKEGDSLGRLIKLTKKIFPQIDNRPSQAKNNDRVSGWDQQLRDTVIPDDNADLPGSKELAANPGQFQEAKRKLGISSAMFLDAREAGKEARRSPSLNNF